MKWTTALLLSLFLCLSVSATALAVENHAVSVSISGTLDDETTFNGRSTLALDWQIMANKEGLTLRYAQGLRLAYDNTILQLMSWDGADVIADDAMGTVFQPVSQAGCIGVFETSLVVSAAQSASGQLGYLNCLLGSPYEAYDCPRGTFVSLAQVRFAFRAGKSDADLTAGSIRLMSVSELAATSQSTAVLLNTDENELTSYEYRVQAHGAALGGDTLDAPDITYPNSTIGGFTGETDMGAVDPVGSADSVESSESAGETSDSEEMPTSGESLDPSVVSVHSDEAGQKTVGSGFPWLPVVLAGAVLLAIAIVVIRWRKRVSASGSKAQPED